MMGQEPDFADMIDAQIPRPLKYCFIGVGAASGWYYARAAASPITLSYIIGGAALGFCLPAALRASIRLVKIAIIAAAALLVLNYALLIPFGQGDRLPGWINTGKAALRLLNPVPLARRWGKDVEIRPAGR